MGLKRRDIAEARANQEDEDEGDEELRLKYPPSIKQKTALHRNGDVDQRLSEICSSLRTLEVKNTFENIEKSGAKLRCWKGCLVVAVWEGKKPFPQRPLNDSALFLSLTPPPFIT